MQELPMKPNPTNWLVTPKLNEPEKWTYPIRFSSMEDMETSSDMGWHKANDKDRLREIVDGRPVVLMLHGQSIGEFEGRAEEFKSADVCYMSINKFEIMERRILSKIGRQLSIVFLMSEQEIPRRIVDVHAFLDRRDGLLMTTWSALSWAEEEDYLHVVDEHDRQLYVMPRLLCRPVYPISLALILDELVRCRVKKVVLLGADGYTPKVAGDLWNQMEMLKTYYGSDEFVKERTTRNRSSGIGVGTKHFNETYKYDGKTTTVYNVSPDSALVQFPRINYGTLKEVLGCR